MKPLTAAPPNAYRDEPAPIRSDFALHDLQFRALLGAAAWSRLPPMVRQRFSKRLSAGVAVTYAGDIIESRRTRLGWLLAQLCRLIGAPLPLCDDVAVPVIVAVTADNATGGQVWTRIYGRSHGFPQVIRSSKRFAGPTGLEEYLGCGFGIALKVSADTKGLHFHSDHYFMTMGAARLRLPRWLQPGLLTIDHVDRGDGFFTFVLVLHHALLGEIIHQTGLFSERCASNVVEVMDG